MRLLHVGHVVRLKWPSVTSLTWQELVEYNSFTTIRSRCLQNLKSENLRSSFGRLRQKIAPKSVPHVPYNYFSTNQVIACFVALSFLKVMLHEPIFNPCYTRQLLTQLCCGNGMLHETIFNATLLATLEPRLLLNKYGGQ